MLAATERVDGAVARHTEEPGRHGAARRVIAVRTGPAAQEDILEDLFGDATIPDEPRNQREDETPVTVAQPRQRRFVAVSGLLHELPAGERLDRCLFVAERLIGETLGRQVGHDGGTRTTDNTMIRFNGATPGTIAAGMAVTGLQSGESIVGIDVRPANGQLYAVGSTGRMYTINPATGAATQSGPSALSLTGTVFGVDFNPVPDRLRVVSDQEQNLRINVETAEATVDGALAYAGNDANAGANPNVVAAGYTNSMAGAQSTTLYVIDSNLDILATQAPPNEGVLNTVGPLGVNASEIVGFDIAADGNRAFAAVTPQGASASELHSIDLTSGRATRVGAIGGGQTVRGLAYMPGMAAPAAPAAQPAPAPKPMGQPAPAPVQIPR